MGRPPKFPDEIECRIACTYIMGATVAELMAAYGVSRTCITNLLARRNVVRSTFIDPGTDPSRRYQDIPGFPGYKACDDGTIWSSVASGASEDRLQLMTPQADKDGYQRLMVTVEGQKKLLKVHHAVLAAFVGPCPPGMQACHDDDNPSNNRLSNLRWGTPKSNTEDQFKNGIRRRVVIRDNSYAGPAPRGLPGSRNHKAKLREDDIPEIRRLYASGVHQREIASRYGIHQTTVQSILAGKHWRHA